MKPGAKSPYYESEELEMGERKKVYKKPDSSEESKGSERAGLVNDVTAPQSP
jgi:hypothetical protein